MEEQDKPASLPRAQPPEESAPVQIKPISKVAGGVPAILSTVKSAWTEMGPVRGTRALLQLNQTGGFDCPGCAWPEPDTERSHAEFCENGAKHVADEATTKRLTPEFFQRWSVADLSEQSDYWLGQQGRLTEPMVLLEGHSLPANHLGRCISSSSQTNCMRLVLRTKRSLHLGPRQQRSSFSLSTIRAAIWDQQSARLLQHVPRVERHRAQ